MSVISDLISQLTGRALTGKKQGGAGILGTATSILGGFLKKK